MLKRIYGKVRETTEKAIS